MVEINKLRASMERLESAHNLLVQVSKVQAHQIQNLEFGLNHFAEIFYLLIKNNPALFYAKLNDQLLTLQDNVYNLKDTLQMPQVQKLPCIFHSVV